MDQSVNELLVGKLLEPYFYKNLSKLQQKELLKLLVPLIKCEVEKQLNNKRSSQNTIWHGSKRRFCRIITDFFIFLFILFAAYFFFYLKNEIAHMNGDRFYQTFSIN